MNFRKRKKLYISDLDGTLLGDDATLSLHTRKTLKKLIADGANITVASARSLASIRQILKGIPFDLPAIALNGAFISDLDTGKHLLVNDMPKKLIGKIFDYIKSYNCFPFISTCNDQGDHLYCQHATNDGMQWFYDNRKACNDRSLCEVDDIAVAFEENVVAFTVINTYNQLINLAKSMQKDFGGKLQMHFFENPYSPAWYWLTIHDKKACKSVAIKELIKMRKFKLKDVVVFGDNLNDLNMFKTAGRAVAVGNATAQVKKHADEIIGNNTDHSVVNYIESDFNTKR